MDDLGADRELIQRVDMEVWNLVLAAGEVELASVYRTLVARIGAHVVPHIAEVLSRRLRKGELEIEPRPATPEPGAPDHGAPGHGAPDRPARVFVRARDRSRAA